MKIHTASHQQQAELGLRSQSAFTMIEIAIALGVIGFALVAIIGILPTGLQVQRDNRAETIINQDGTFWLETIRNGAQGLDNVWLETIRGGALGMADLVDYVDQIELHEIDEFAGVTNVTTPPFSSGAEIVGLLSRGAITNAEAYASVWAISGSAAEKEPLPADRELGFRYLMHVHIRRATNFARPFGTHGTNFSGLKPGALESLYHLRLTLSYPLIREGQAPSRSKSYSTLVHRNVRTNLNGVEPLYFFTQ
jgi:hypothetical protein